MSAIKRIMSRWCNFLRVCIIIIIIIIIQTRKKLHQRLIFSLFQITIHSYTTGLTFNQKQSSIWPPLRRPRTPIPCRSVRVAFVCLLVDYESEWPLTVGIVLHCIALHCIILYYISLYCIALHLHCTALHCIALYCIVLYCIVLHCIVLHCTALHCRPCG